ncbi:hypothetical protein CYMTET_26238 [Cymbomonas tetramitiformis]|uniref:Uncharacterized protein n=1 Tax=Cymbomonas tetramitiformis TaxID=36881 RepID=A0AAE0FTR2_9CHLO|nr:hypothetical protein CYMTET_26238 [Cymbomonas tetramitiformis]
MVRRAGAGPAPCPVGNLTVPFLTDAFRQLKNPQIRERVEELAKQVMSEDGVSNGAQHFFRKLPLDRMLCHVSIFLPKAHGGREGPQAPPISRAACVRGGEWRDDGVSDELLAGRDIVAVVTYWKGDREQGHAVSLAYPANPFWGFIQGLVGFMYQITLGILSAILDLYMYPDHLAYKYGLLGCVAGCFTAPFVLLLRPLYAALIFLDSLLTGTYNWLFVGPNGRTEPRTYIFNVTEKTHLNRLRQAKRHNKRQGHDVWVTSKHREMEIRAAYKTAKEVRRIFKMTDHGKDFKECKHRFKVLRAVSISSLPQKDAGLRILLEGLYAQGDPISFTTFCIAYKSMLRDIETNSADEAKFSIAEIYQH